MAKLKKKKYTKAAEIRERELDSLMAPLLSESFLLERCLNLFTD